MPQENVRIQTELIDALRKLAENNGTSIAQEAARVLSAGFRAMAGEMGKELDAAHQALNASGIPTHDGQKFLNAAARINIMRSRAEQAIIADLLYQAEPGGPSECTHSLGESCPACVKSTNQDEPLPWE